MITKPQLCSYDPLRDVKEVVSGLAVDVDSMLRTGIVHSTGEDLDNNQIDDPNNVIGLVRDEFAAIDAMRVIRKYGKKSHDSSAAAAAAAATEVGSSDPKVSASAPGSHVSS